MGCDLSIFLFYFLYLYCVGFWGNVFVRNWRVKTSRVKERDFPKGKATITLDDRRESDNTIIADAVKWMKVNK